MTYAAGTQVPVERTRAEIDTVLCRNGASSVGVLNDEDESRAVIAFTMRGAKFRLEVPLPKPGDEGPKKNAEPRGWWRLNDESRARWHRDQLAQMRRERWRAVLLLLKSKLEVVRIGVTSLEQEFMANMVLPNGATAYQAMSEAIRAGLGAPDAPKQLKEGE